MLAIDLSEEVLNQILFERPRKCEGEDHHRGILGHNPESPGAYYVITPCHGCKVVQCEGRVLHWKETGLLRCSTCKTWQRYEDCRFIPVDSL